MSMIESKEERGSKDRTKISGSDGVDVDTLSKDWKYKRRSKFRGRSREVRGTHELVVEFEVTTRYIGGDVGCFMVHSGSLR